MDPIPSQDMSSRGQPDVSQATTRDDSDRNGFRSELAAKVAEAKRVMQELRVLLEQVGGPVPAPAGQDQPMPPSQRRLALVEQPYPFRSRPQKMAPRDFQLGQKQLQAGLDEGLLAGQVRREWDKFKDHTFGVARQDWDATWRNWIRTSADRLPRLGTTKPQPRPVAARRPPEPQEQPAEPGEALVSIRGILDKLGVKRV